MKSKIISLFIFISVLWSALIFRAAYLQFVPHEKLNALQEKQFQTVVSLPARRGSIVDRHGKELAMSSPTYSIYADPKIIADRKATAKLLSKVLKENSNEIFAKIKDKNKRFVWIERLVSVSQVEEIKTAKIRKTNPAGAQAEAAQAQSLMKEALKRDPEYLQRSKTAELYLDVSAMSGDGDKMVAATKTHYSDIYKNNKDRYRSVEDAVEAMARADGEGFSAMGTAQRNALAMKFAAVKKAYPYIKLQPDIERAIVPLMDKVK